MDGSEIKLPSKLITEVVNAIDLRNEVVHAGAPPPSRQELSTMLGAIGFAMYFWESIGL